MRSATRTLEGVEALFGAAMPEDRQTRRRQRQPVREMLRDLPERLGAVQPDRKVAGRLEVGNDPALRTERRPGVVLHRK